MSLARHTTGAMSSGQGQRWYIDAWSVGDGSLFASRRAARDDVWREDAEREVDTVVLRAPDFDPVQVSRALAFGATQRGAQEGFSLDGVQEQAFGSLEELRELARRAYIASALGDSGPEGDGVPPPGDPPPEGDPSPDDYRLGDDGIREGLADILGVLAIEPGARSPARDRLAERVLDAMDPHLVGKAAWLLVLGADQTARLPGHGVIGLAGSLLQVAAALAGPYVPVDMAQHSPVSTDTQVLAEWLPARVVIGHAVAHADVWGLLGDALLPAFPVREGLGLPPRCQTWIDALEYLGSDRLHYQQRRHGQWLPLAVAAAAVATSTRAVVLGSLERIGVEPRPRRDAWHQTIAQFVAQLVPAAGLAPEVEGWLRDRCWAYQRGAPAARPA